MHIAVIDIGKTNAKLALVDLASLTELAVVTRPNRALPGPPYPHFDTDGHWDFILLALVKFHQSHRIDAISITTHGACAAFIGHDGLLAAPILDYEHRYPADVIAAYDLLRPSFDKTGSPRLANGLNLGAILHYQMTIDPSLQSRTAKIVTYPQYWAHRLTGIAATDVTSLGCHTDLWNPHLEGFSTLVASLDLAGVLAPPCKPAKVLGAILPEIAALTGLPPDTPVACGIHDSNASLLPHLLTHAPPFSVVSTGTWVVVMTVGGNRMSLDPTRDSLINVNAFGQPTPSARFMGGREYEQTRGQGMPSDSDVQAVLDGNLFLVPAAEPSSAPSSGPSSGPFPGKSRHWTPSEPPRSDPRRNVALAFYLALMTAECLSMTGGNGDVIVEGPFGRNPLYLEMLRAATRRPVLAAASQTGTAIGAALLFASPDRGTIKPSPAAASPANQKMISYAQAWRSAIP